MNGFSDHVLTYSRRRRRIPWFLLACLASGSFLFWAAMHYSAMH